MLHTHGGSWSQALGVQINPYTYAGNGLSAQNVKTIGGARMNRFIGETFARTSATPDGYTMGAWVLPIKAGGMSSWQAQMVFAGAGDLLQGGPMVGDGAITFSETGDLALTVGMAGDGAFGMTGSAGLALTIGMDGAGNITITGAGGLSMIIPCDGTGSFGMAGLGDLKGFLDMEGSWGGATPLSPEALAAAVWAELNSNGEQYGDVVTRTDKNAKLGVALSA